MRRFLLTALFLLFFCGYADAGSATFTLLSDATATGAGDTAITSNPYHMWGCDVDLDYTTGDEAYTAVVVRIEGNQRGTVFASDGMAVHTLDSTELSARKASFSIISHPQKQVRANLTTLTASGTTPAVTAVCTGVE